jgi:ABC-type uncharacterized transport system fused permease/ATPase subunit
MIGCRANFEYFSEQSFSVNFHFLKNGKRCNQDFFTMNTIEYGLSFGNVKSILSLNFFSMLLRTMAQEAIAKVDWNLAGSARWNSLSAIAFERTHQDMFNSV